MSATISQALAAYYVALDAWVEAEAAALTDQRPVTLDWVRARRSCLDAARAAFFAAVDA